MELYPFKLSYVTKSPIWGGRRLLDQWGKKSESQTIGESWELTVRANEKSVILNGAHAGKTLESVIEAYGGNLIATDFSERVFPLLVKLIDAGDVLSVQVHPDNDYAKRVENDRGKTEMWYIVEAEEGAELICGLKEGATEADFAKAVEAGDPLSALNRIPVHAGECYFIPSGMPHAIGKGILIAEIQQNCDLTYRVYDFDRRQADGSLRELHVEKALDVVRAFSDEEVEALRYARRSDTLVGGDILADCEYFRVEKLMVEGDRQLPDSAVMRHVLCLEGEGSFLCHGEKYPISKGDSYYLPPLRDLQVKGHFTALVSGV